jgi:hypothetical protein
MNQIMHQIQKLHGRVKNKGLRLYEGKEWEIFQASWSLTKEKALLRKMIYRDR